jgi:ribosome maturation factor RimP
MRLMSGDHDLISDVRARVSDLGFEVVDVRKRGSGGRVGLQVRIDRPESEPGHGVTVDDCASVSRALERWLDESGTLGPRYVLEVSSPGIERPVRWPEHWRRFEGHDVRVKLPGHGRVTATILRVSGDETVVLRPAGGEEVAVPMVDAQDATLVVDWSEIARPKAKS